MVTVRKERPAEAATRDALLDLAYGPARFAKTSERLREGRRPELALVAAEGRRIVGTVQLWQVSAGSERLALLLGPLAVAPDRRKRGIGSTLVHHALREAARRRYGAVLLVGDAPITRGLASPARRPARCGCPGPTSGTGCLGASSSPARSTAPVDSSAPAVRSSSGPSLRPWSRVSSTATIASRRTRHDPRHLC